MKFLGLATAFLTLALAGCASSPSYDNLGGGGHYSASPSVSYSIGVGYGAYYPAYRPVYRPAYGGYSHRSHHHHDHHHRGRPSR